VNLRGGAMGLHSTGIIARTAPRWRSDRRATCRAPDQKWCENGVKAPRAPRQTPIFLVFRTPAVNVAKVDVEGSNPFSRSKTSQLSQPVRGRPSAGFFRILPSGLGAHPTKHPTWAGGVGRDEADRQPPRHPSLPIHRARWLDRLSMALRGGKCRPKAPCSPRERSRTLSAIPRPSTVRGDFFPARRRPFLCPLPSRRPRAT
jgi:hypothetical protein